MENIQILNQTCLNISACGHEEMYLQHFACGRNGWKDLTKKPSHFFLYRMTSMSVKIDMGFIPFPVISPVS